MQQKLSEDVGREAAVVALGSLREEERMRLLILANTLPILVEATDQGPLTSPQLFSPACAACARSRINQKKSSFEREVEEERRDKCQSNQPNDASVWAKGSCMSPSSAVQTELRDGDKRDAQLSDEVDSGVWSEGTDKESIGDNKEDDVNKIDAPHKRNVNEENTAAEANAFLAEVQQQVKDKIELMTRLEGRMEAMQGIGQQLEKAERENGLMEERVREVEEENRVLRSKLAALERKNAETNRESHSRSDCCKEACASLRAMVESLKEERAQMLTQGEEEAKLVAENHLGGRVEKTESVSFKSKTGVEKQTYDTGAGWPSITQAFLVATIAVIVAFAYLHLHCTTLNRGTQFPM